MKILILTNHQVGLYKFRLELLMRLIDEKHRVYVSAPEGEYTEEFKSLGIEILINDCLERRGKNPLHDLKLIKNYNKIINDIHPDVVFTYTIKPNIYGGYICGKRNIPYIANVTGLGTSIENGGFTRFLTLQMYKKGLKKAKRIFFQNAGNRDYMVRSRIVEKEKTDVLPGSGVNTKNNCYEPYPDKEDPIIFTMIGRIMKDKGINEFLEAAKAIRKAHKETEFRLIGDFDENYEEKVCDAKRQGIVKYLGFKKDVHKYIAESHAIIHASYHEGMSNVILEAASTGRPVIATDVHGCIEAYDPDVTGISFKAKDSKSLIAAIERFIALPGKEKEAMGRAGRQKMEKEFDRNIVVNKYLEEINGIKEE